MFPVSIPKDGLNYTSEGLPEEEILPDQPYQKAVINSKATLSETMNKLSISRLLQAGKKVGEFIHNAFRKKYMPYIMTGMGLFSLTNTAKGQIDYFMIGGGVGYQTVWDDYYTNKEGGRTKDGKTYDARIVWSGTNIRGQLMGGFSQSEKFEDQNNYYKATYLRLGASLGILLLGDSEDAVIWYGGPYVGIVNSSLEGKVEGILDENSLGFRGQGFSAKKFHSYDQNSLEVGLSTGFEFNIAERVKLGIEGNRFVVPKGTLDNIRLGDRSRDHTLAVKLAAYYNFSRGI